MPEIRPVTPKDLETLAALAHEIWNEHFPPIIGQAQVDYMVEKFQSAHAIREQLQNGYEYYFITIGQEPAGYMGIIQEDQHIQLSKLYIRSDMRGQGLGKKAMGFLFETARERGIRRIELTVNKYNTDSIRAYEKMGFINVESIVMDIGGGFVMDDYRMALDI
jgi:RimJ/RimL family protein N-acetyltransferase